MPAIGDEGFVIVTGAGGHIGREVCRLLSASGSKILPVDVDGATKEIVTCDLGQKKQVTQLFQSHPVRAVIHLAGILPSSFQSNPFAGVDVNLTGCIELMREAVHARIKRFVFASSIGVYGLSVTPSRPLTEQDPAVPDEPYGASKRVVELVGDTLGSGRAIEFVFLTHCEGYRTGHQEDFLSLALPDLRATFRGWLNSHSVRTTGGTATGARRGCRAHAHYFGRDARSA